ncbi:MAG TPA: NAD(P)-dependent oxidoreductase, partial [Vicinamibacterales bacterium]|nr:NAD(P)-dependent oxidoreductase [Vicinamibacterales bacterium]
MTIAFFELEGWERAALAERLSEHDLLFYEDVLSPAHLPALAACAVVSPFIYSRIGPEALAAMPALKMVATRSTGFDHIDVAACRARGIAVSNVPEYGSQTVAEHTFALILALSRKLVPAYRAMRNTEPRSDEARRLRGFDLRGKTLGVVGAGNIGLHVVRMAESFGMRVLVFDTRRRQTLADLLEFEYVPLEALLRESDIVSLHCPATNETRHMINADSLAIMKRGALLINTARGELVDTAALLAALQSGQLGGAGLDVFEGEAIVREEAQILSRAFDREQLESAIRAHQLLKRDDVIVTPHNGFNSREAVERILDTTVRNIQ